MRDALTYVYAALLDVLGYRSRLSEDRLSGTMRFKDSLGTALQALASLNEADFSYQAISDTIIITCAQRDALVEFLGHLKAIFVAFLNQGLFIRGGLSFAQHFKSGPITYSHAVARAYELESDAAVFPRVVIDHNIIEMFRESGDLGDISISDLVGHRNGTYYLHVVDSGNWARLYEAAKAMYEREADSIRRNEHVFIKHAWFEDYLFACAPRNTGLPRYLPQLAVLK